MKFAATSASALALLFALSACGGGAEDTEATPAETPAAADAAPEVTASEAPAETAAPEPEPSETAAAAAAPTPTPTPAATRAAAAPAAVAEPAAFAMCKACHSVEPGKNGIGPSLAGIWGEKAGAVPGFDFSDAMESSGLVWNQSGLDRYLTDPRGTVPGTKMAFGGVKDAAKRQEIIDYIKGL
jgi:cytochrome c2